MFNLKNHYWPRTNGLVYSSARKADLPSTDATYQAWLRAGGRPTAYPKDADGNENAAVLAQVLGENPYPPTLEQARAVKLLELNAAFERAERNGHLMSSVGCEINADETANRNISGLITRMEETGEPSTLFCDYHNQMWQVTLADLKTMQLEVIRYGQGLYATKWRLRQQINKAAPEELDTISWPEEQ